MKILSVTNLIAMIEETKESLPDNIIIKSE